MALLCIDSFDHYVTADLTEKWTTAANSGTGVTQTINATGGRRGSGSFRLTAAPAAGHNGTAYVQRTLAPDATSVIGVSFVMSSAVLGAGGFQVLSIRDGATAQVSLRLNSDFTLSVVRGTHGGTVLGTTAVPLTVGVVAYIELKVLIHASAGTVDLRVNGAARLTLTGQNTRNTGATQWTGVQLGVGDSIASTWSGSAGTIDYDDLYVLDGTGAAPWNTFLGDCRVDARYPTAAGATTGWTPSAGANWQCVDDTAPNDDTDYTAAAAAGVTDTFVVQDAPVAGAAIYGVQHCLSAKKTDAGTASIAPVIRHSGVDYVGANLNPGTAYAVLQQINQTNPGTSAAWTEAGFNAAEFGYKRTV